MSKKENELNKGSFLYINDEEKAEWGYPEGYPYKEIGITLNGTFEFINDRGIYIYQITDENFTIVDGKSYAIIWDGITYQCIATTFSGIPTLGNLAIIGAGDDTGEPFLFYLVNGQKLIATNSTTATHTIIVHEEIVYPITSEFLPDSVKNRMSLIVINAQMPSPADWCSVTYGNGKFVAVAESSDQASYSEDGINWASSTMPSSADWCSVTYGNGKFVAVAIYSDKVAYSEDGINWASSTMPSSARWYSVTYGNGKFVAVAESSDQASYSEDGINWASSTMPSSADWCSVTYGNGKFVAVAMYSDKVAYSEDGINWASSTMPSPARWYSVTYGNGKFVAVARGSIQEAYSKDGITWKNTFEYLSQNNSDITESVRSVIGIPAYSTANNGQFLRVIDGIPTWTEFLPTLTSPNGTKYQLTVSDDGTLSAVAVS